jgi:hypothetical protein
MAAAAAAAGKLAAPAGAIFELSQLLKLLLLFTEALLPVMTVLAHAVAG